MISDKNKPSVKKYLKCNLYIISKIKFKQAYYVIY